MGNNIFRFDALVAKQSTAHEVLMIRATAAEIHQIAQVDRLGRDEEGAVSGFQRPQIASHIAEIRRYLSQSDAVLPNAIVLAFVGDARVITDKNGGDVLEVNASNGKPALVVDGQQRLSALTQTKRDDFQLFVSCLICKDIDELRRQFILINNTKPLPKSLIYELLPSVRELPDRLSSRSLAAAVTEKLNFSKQSSLFGKVKMQSNPAGIINDTTLQKAIMNSESSGALQVLSRRSPDVGPMADLVSNFYAAVQDVFAEDWINHKPATSRLLHGAGIVAMGYVMDEIFCRTGDASIDAFRSGLKPLVGKTAWTSGHWSFSDSEIVAWNHIENTPRQYQQLAEHLVGFIRRSPKMKRQVASR
ncbi:DGQHR domain-containing protein DpdB [Pseudogulbenkiania sp. MAI-1]|uniref:DGQHR domain-containing protein DpdB n=1 Tax=Pseudogulbenkiania sp. MAI-1 TaxID=990370 RepID=UPI0009FC346C|nr:DGQHR domain-containing protein DpdB [Pseudogulbenkiania sp. MAI-1]